MSDATEDVPWPVRSDRNLCLTVACISAGFWLAVGATAAWLLGPW